jgi:hypothetical protein
MVSESKIVIGMCASILNAALYRHIIQKRPNAMIPGLSRFLRAVYQGQAQAQRAPAFPRSCVLADRWGSVSGCWVRRFRPGPNNANNLWRISLTGRAPVPGVLARRQMDQLLHCREALGFQIIDGLIDGLLHLVLD